MALASENLTSLAAQDFRTVDVGVEDRMSWMASQAGLILDEALEAGKWYYIRTKKWSHSCTHSKSSYPRYTTTW